MRSAPRKWQTIRHQVLPAAFPGILTGLILALSRAIGETAPLITIGALTYVPFLPNDIWSPFTVLPIQIFNWVSRPQAAFAENAAAGIVVLLALLLAMNAVAIVLRDRFQRRSSAKLRSQVSSDFTISAVRFRRCSGTEERGQLESRLLRMTTESWSQSARSELSRKLIRIIGEEGVDLQRVEEMRHLLAHACEPARIARPETYTRSP